MSRGRQSNQLYLSEEVESERPEFAPTSPPSLTAIERLAARLATSDAQLLAIDSGRPVDTGEAERRLADAQRERRAVEQGASRWHPGRRQRLKDAREREALARNALSHARRRVAEARHAARPLETPKELEQRRENLHARIAERTHDHVLDRGRELGREGDDRPTPRPLQAVPRYTLTRREAAAALGVSLNHFERKVQPELKVVISGQLILIPVAELERWVQRHARLVVELRGLDG